MKTKGLGKGFEGLIPVGLSVNDIAVPGEQVRNLPINLVIPNPEQPRKMFDNKALEELAQSIKEHGIIQPLVVTPKGDKYRIVAGERRYRGAQLAKLNSIPAIVRNHEELEELEIALVENVQRVDLSPLEQAVSIVRLRDQFSMSPKEISKKLGKAETTISNIVRLLQLPDEAITALQNNTISEGHARAILALKTDEKAQNELLNKIITQKLSVRDAEKFVQAQKSSKIVKNELQPQYKKRLNNIQNNLGIKAKITQKQNGGSIAIVYRNDEELEKLLNKLEN